MSFLTSQLWSSFDILREIRWLDGESEGRRMKWNGVPVPWRTLPPVPLYKWLTYFLRRSNGLCTLYQRLLNGYSTPFTLNPKCSWIIIVVCWTTKSSSTSMMKSLIYVGAQRAFFIFQYNGLFRAPDLLSKDWNYSAHLWDITSIDQTLTRAWTLIISWSL